MYILESCQNFDSWCVEIGHLRKLDLLTELPQKLSLIGPNNI